MVYESVVKLKFGIRGCDNINKRQGKKRYKKALEIMRTHRKTGIGVTIINHVFVDKNGKQCDAMEKGSRMIMLKRPKIQYYKPTN